MSGLAGRRDLLAKLLISTTSGSPWERESRLDRKQSWLCATQTHDKNVPEYALLFYLCSEITPMFESFGKFSNNNVVLRYLEHGGPSKLVVLRHHQNQHGGQISCNQDLVWTDQGATVNPNRLHWISPKMPQAAADSAHRNLQESQHALKQHMTF